MLLISIFSLLFLILTALASSIWESTLWGLSAWAFVSYTFGAVSLAIIVVVLVLSRSISEKLFQGGSSFKRQNIWWIPAAAAAIIMLWLFRARHDLWGERHAIATAVENGVIIRPGGPLAAFLHWAVYRFVNSTLIWNGTTASALVSAVSGLCYVAAAVYAVRLLIEDRESGSRAISTVFILSGGYIVLFFGSGGNTPLASLFSLLFIISALLFIREKTSLILPAVLLLISVLSHPSNVYLIPGFIYMAVLGLRSPGRRLHTTVALEILIVAWVALEFIFSAVVGSPTRFLLSLTAASFKTIHGSGILALPGHFLIALNGFLIIGPASAAALALLATGIFKRDPTGAGREKTLLILLASTAALMIICAPRYLDGGLRWDIFASTGPAFALYVLFALRRRFTGPRGLIRALVLLAALGIFHTLPWLILNASPGAAEKRLLSLPIAPGRSEMILGSRAMDGEDFDKAHKWFSLSVEKDSTNGRAYFRLGELNMKKEDYVDAITSFLSALELEPENHVYRLELAEAYIAKRWFEEAIDNLEELTSIYPDTALYWRRLGYARNHSRLHSEAIEAYENALAIEPDSEQNIKNLTSAVLNRAAELQGKGDLEEAKKLYFRAIKLYPLDWVAHNNLAVMEMNLGNIEEAYKILRKAIDLSPFIPKLNLNMGLVLEKMGKEKEALQYLYRSAELDPLHSGAGIHIERIEQKLSNQSGE